MEGDGGKVLEIRNLTKFFELRTSLFKMFGEAMYVRAVNRISLDIHEAEVVGLVGESGCGKTTTGRLIARLETPTSGSIIFKGQDIATLDGRDLHAFRRNVQMIFQDPYESLNPRFTVFQAVAEPLIIHGIGETPEDRLDLVSKALEDAGLRPAEEFIERFPHELSGGQRQRVAIARALVIGPKCIVADEPVSMLDVSIRAGVMNLMLDLRDKYRIPYLFITHDIAVARYMSDRIAVMYLGKIAEIGDSEEVIRNPVHPYTRALIAAVPVPDPEFKHGRVPISGDLPSPIDLPTGCHFHPRCPYAKEICREVDPPEIEVAPGHLVLCHFAEQLEAEGFEPGQQVTGESTSVSALEPGSAA
jgi:peptide/nickel transport system ATP-binding protein